VTVTVAAPVLTTITISGGGTVVAGLTLQLTASPKDQAGNAIAATITWSSGATGIATVSNTGLVTGVAVGTAVITAAAGSVSATTTVTVSPVPPVLTTIAISGGTTVVATSTLQLTAAPKDQNGNALAATIVWSSGTPASATVGSSTGLVTGVAAGTSVITATSGTVSANVTITVTPQILTSITVSGGTTVQVGQTLQLLAAAKDQVGKAMTAVITWVSDALGIATVNASGLVTGVAAGTANVTASSGGVSSTPTAVTVTAAPVFPASANVNATDASVFDPATVDIRVGGVVSFIFGALGHNVFFDVKAGAPGDIAATTTNATITRTFNVAGDFRYVCTIHGGMVGHVIVH
jgi:plastocyanin